MPAVVEKLETLVGRGELERDPAQFALAARLDRLNEDLAEARLANKGSALGWLFARNRPRRQTRGLYIWGDVGRGKTMLMDLYFETTPIIARRRVHFHEFMQDVHDRVHAFRTALRRGEAGGNDPVPPVAAAIAADAELLCFDEFHVADIADAMILGRLFERLFALGVTIVATSNSPPHDLYRDGLNRQLFLPFIELLTDHVAVCHLDARTDFRLEKLAGHQVYITPLGAPARAAMDATWHDLTGTGAAAPTQLPVRGRQLKIPQAIHGIARFGFDDICRQPLGAADYLKIAHAFHTVFIDDIPAMDDAARNEARRFITLVDTFYDNNVKLIVSAAVEPGDLYRGTVGHEVFAFRRTASRLVEMSSAAYLALPHGKRDR